MRLDDHSDAELVRLFKSGDVNAFDEIVRRFQDRLYRLCCVWLYDSQLAADATQEVFVRSFKGLRSFRFRSAPFTWLYRTARNVCNEFNRVRRTETLEDEPLASNDSPATSAADLETARRVRRFVAALPERQQEVVLLRIFEELSVRETAQAMNCREGTVKALLHKATKNMKKAMQKAGIDHE